MRTKRAWGLVAVVLLALTAAACTQPPSGGGGGSSSGWNVNPATTDPAIASDPTFTHLAFAPTTTARGKLVVMFHGTGSNPQAHLELANALRGDGYHVILLRYSATLSTPNACPTAVAGSDPDCHRVFRSETTFGAGVTDPDGGSYDHALVSISQANSVMNRLLKLVDHLRVIAPTAGWGEFQDRTGAACDVFNTTYGACELNWGDVVAAGHSQGAGVALYLGKFFPLRRVMMLSGSYDAFDLGGGSFTVAPWITEGGMDVPASRIGTLLHTSDYGLNTFRAVENALGLPGSEVNVTTSSPPYGSSNRLITSTASTCPWDGTPGHNSTTVDVCAPDYLYWATYTYLAGS